ncbi:MAG: hypothetical protein ABJC39_02405 [Chloroflexota bacterium]
MTMRSRQLIVALGIAVIVVWAILVMTRTAAVPAPSIGPTPTGGIGVPASTAIPAGSDAAPSPVGPSPPGTPP